MMLRLRLLLLLFSHSACSMLLGWVESPGYPSGYLPHASLNWSRCAPKGHTLSIRLIHLDLEDSQDCENDAVKVFSNGSLISVLCGRKTFEELQSTVNPLLVSASGGCLSLSFHSDYSNIQRHTGFRGFYTVQDYDECEDPDNRCTQFCHNFIGGYHCTCHHGYHLDADKFTCTVSCSEDLSGLQEGNISSPFWPGSYAENANCQHILSVDTHLQLELHFSEVFDVEESTDDDQCIDALRIETPTKTLGPFCGHTPPPSPFLTHSHHVKIHFTSDGSGTNKGFTLRFQTRDKVCPGDITSHSTVSPQKPEYNQGEKVTVTCDLGYVTNTEGAKIMSSEYETTCQSTGIWTPHYPCEPVNCGFPDIPENGILKVVGSDNSHTHYKDKIQFNCSSKFYTMEGDDTYTCSASGDWVSDGGKKEMPKCTPICGIPSKNPTNAGRILGGQTAELGEIPWHLLIKEPSRGGATLINDRWAVTAAHVVDKTEETSLVLYGGLIDGRTTNNPQLSNAVVMESEKIIIHPGYNRNIPPEQRTNYDNDIALIKLASIVNFGPNLLPICLPEANRGLVENEQGTVSGFGVTESNQNPKKLVTSRVLKYANIGVYSLAQCQDTPYMSGERMTFTNNMFCAGATGKDSCQKDSGGPFVLPMLSSRGPYYLTGIVSWGPPCEERRYKGYYTKVENYVDWIKETVNKIDTS